MRPLRRPVRLWLILALAALAAPFLRAADDRSAPSWNADEYARMARPEAPGAPAAETPFNPANYRIPQQLPPAPVTPTAPEETGFKELAKTGKLYIESQKYFDFDPDTQRFYSRERSTIRYGEYSLSADKVLIDRRLQEAEAEGAVVMTWKNSTVKADKVNFNFERQDGWAYHASGTYGPLIFKGPENEEPGNPAFRKENRQIDRLHDVSLTSCQFPIPHYCIRAKEFIVSERDRVYARNAILYVWDVPVAYMPAYSRSLVEKSPWSFILGYDTELGAVMRVTYDYYYKDYVPAEKGPGEKGGLVRRSFVQVTGIGDVMSQRGVGGGVRSNYSLRSGRDEGSLDAYSIWDHNRHVQTADDKHEEDNPERFWLAWRHRTQITPELQLMTNADWPSDPEIHQDILDFFDKDQLRRVPERQARAALTWNKEDFLVRILGDVKDRIGRDRVNYFGDNRDDNADFDVNFDSRGRFVPGFTFDTDNDPELPRSRWARVSERAPQITLATPWLKPSCLPLYYQADLNVINNLDKGLNVLDNGDDSWVRGVDFYQSLMYALQFGDSSSLVTKAGVGAGELKRQDDNYHFDLSKAKVLPDGNRQLDGLIFTDDQTFLVGKEKFTLKDYDPSFAYGDFETKWTTRITDALSAHLRYFVRQNSGEPLGEFYRRIGDRLTQSDLYDFRLNKNEVSGGVDYRLAQPDLGVSFDAGQNLRSKSDLTPNEEIFYVGANTHYNSPNKVVTAVAGLKYDELEKDFPYGENRLDPQTVSGYGSIQARPIGDYLWTGLRGDVVKYIRGTSDFTGDNLDYSATGLIGAPIGLKWVSELQVTYDGQADDIDRIRLLIKRDLHDVVAGLVFTARRKTIQNTVGNQLNESRQWDRFSVQLQMSIKSLNQQAPVGAIPLVAVKEKGRTLPSTAR